MSRLAVLCSGQGGQHPAMFAPFEDAPAAAAIMEEAGAVLGADPRAVAADDTQAFDNRAAQVLVCATALSAWTALAARLPVPAVFVGYSIGELAAYGCAGAWSGTTVLRLAALRAELMDRAGTGSGLLAVRGLTRVRIQELCQAKGVFIAIINDPTHFIIGGPQALLNECAATAEAAGAQQVKLLPVAVAAHTPLLRAAAETFHSRLLAEPWSMPTAPVLAGINGMMVESRAAAIDSLAAQIASPLDFAACLTAAWERGARVFLELGPGTALARIARTVLPRAQARAIEEFRSLDGVAEWVRRNAEEEN